jgi:hypothetical protein
VQGTWTCSGNVLTYINSGGTWDYTLAPDGKSMSANGGAAVAVRMGSVPASARSRDLGSAANNVAADVLGIDRTPSATPKSAPAPVATLTPKAPADDGAKSKAASEARSLFERGKASASVAGQAGGGPADWSAAEDRFRESALEFRKAGDAKNERIALANAEVARRQAAKPSHRLAQSPKPDIKAPASRRSLRCKLYQKTLDQDDPYQAELAAKLKKDYENIGC